MSTEEKQLDFNAPLLSVRRFAAATPPHPPSSTELGSGLPRAEVARGEAARERPRRSLLPFYKSDLKSGPVRNPGVVPFVWEQAPGQPKGSAFAGGSPVASAPPPVVAPKPPPGRIRGRPPDKREEHILPDASDSSINGAVLSKSSSITSSISTLATMTKKTTSSPSSAGNGALEISIEERTGEAVLKTESPVSRVQQRSSGIREENEEEDAFSDALDTLSRTESFFLNCSVSGMTGAMEAWEHSGRFFADPQARDFMMGRFLPAAQAVAAESPPYPPRKAAATALGRVPPRRLLGDGAELRCPAITPPSQRRPILASSYPRLVRQFDVGSGRSGEEEADDEGEEADYDDSGHLPTKGCGLLPGFLFKSSFGLMNPLPAMKTRTRGPPPAARRPNPKLRPSRHESVGGDADSEHSWEDVYLSRQRQPYGEEGSKVTSESNRLSYWSDSQTADGSSPYRRSIAGGVSPYRNDAPPSPFREGKGFLGTPKCEDGGECWETASGCQSPVIVETVHVDPVQVVPDENTGFDTGCKCRGIEASPGNVLQQKPYDGVVDADEPQAADRSCRGQMDGTADSGQNHALDCPRPLEAEGKGKDDDNNAFQALLTPPSPKSPSESWLWRTLPSVSSKNSTSRSFMGLPFHPKKQINRRPPTDPKMENIVKTSVSSKGHLPFAHVSPKPANVD